MRSRRCECSVDTEIANRIGLDPQTQQRITAGMLQVDQVPEGIPSDSAPRVTVQQVLDLAKTELAIPTTILVMLFQ